MHHESLSEQENRSETTNRAKSLIECIESIRNLGGTCNPEKDFEDSRVDRRIYRGRLRDGEGGARFLMSTLVRFCFLSEGQALIEGSLTCYHHTEEQICIEGGLVSWQGASYFG